MNSEIYNGNVKVCSYENAEELLDKFRLKIPFNHDKWDRMERDMEAGNLHSGTVPCKKWIGFDNYGMLKDAIRHGWREACERTNHIKVEGLPPIKGIVRRKKKADFGDEIDMQSVYSGDMDTAWNSFEHVVTENIGFHNITILVNMATVWKVSAADAFWKGAAASILADNLIKMGKAVEVIAMDCGTNIHHGPVNNNINLVPVKDFNFPMDREHMHAVLSPGFFRGFMFKAIIRAADDEGVNVAGNLGIPWEPPDTLLAKIFPNRRIIHVPKNIEDSGACETFLKTTLTKLLENSDDA